MKYTKSQKTRKHILDVSMREFGERGYTNTSIKKIANSANISHGLLYNYFENKDDLLKQIFIEGSEKIRTTFENLESESPNLQIFIVNIFEVLRKNSKVWRLMHTIKMQKDLVKIFKNEFNEITDHIVGMLSEYFEDRGAKTPETEALLLFAAIDGVSNHYLINPSYPIDAVIKTLIKRYK